MTRAPVHCTVVIPTKNAMPALRRVVAAVGAQRAPWPFDILVVDSGSDDGTVEYLEALDGVRLIRIAPHEFGHGKTRNFAISKTTAPYVAMITQDAEPASADWLYHLVSAVERRDDVAGAFGPHFAYGDSDPFTRRDLAQHFLHLSQYPAVVNRFQDPRRYGSDVGYRQVLHFFSDNNACLRRSVWERIPYPDVPFGEDQLWADAIIRAGYSKAYASLAAVYHSHTYSVWERFQRSYDESVGFRQAFGYRLDGTIRQVLRSIRARCRRDMKDCCALLSAEVSALEFARQCAMNAAAVLGNYVGAQEKPLFDSLRGVLSWDVARHAAPRRATVAGGSLAAGRKRSVLPR